jgi:hypothetical protein
MGKVVVPPLTAEERKELWESLGSSTAPPSIRRRMEPPPIRGPPGQYEDNHDVTIYIERLMKVITKIREKNRKLEETVAKLRMANLDLIDNFCDLRISNGAKIKRLAEAIGREDLLAPPSP